MKRLYALLVAALLLLVLGLSGCGSDCDSLKDTCEKCPASVKPNCLAIANAGEQSACKDNISVYEKLNCK
jgi:hypothetical protein